MRPSLDTRFRGYDNDVYDSRAEGLAAGAEHCEKCVAPVKRRKFERQRPGPRERDEVGLQRDARMHGKKLQPPPQSEAKRNGEPPLVAKVDNMQRSARR